MMLGLFLIDNKTTFSQPAAILYSTSLLSSFERRLKEKRLTG
jgi:hypothetical protein